ncbi:MAG: bifunctional hydroxymethylpyrimidine kinase/phosphomethylpyrimidine kinase [Alphaproteobacteria bacterium]|nr:bifunctional hydroxymethylpyrimidine kinase/phosphomethylpyrimidine kinase [Alphaproteobacteria bacterium]
MTGLQNMTSRGDEAMQGTMISGRILAIGDSDSCGGSGIQADTKAITALGGYAMTAVTALTAQNTEGVSGTVATTGGFVAKQMRMALKDIGADVIKIGMVPNEEAIESVHYTYMEFAPNVPIVLDPVMISKDGHPMIDREAIHVMRQHFLLHAAIVTPNIAETEMLTGMEIHTLKDMTHAAEIMITLGCQSVLVKGGHFEGETLYDVLFSEEGLEVFEDTRINTPHTHGTGCTLASAIATGLAQKMTMRDSVARARAYVRQAILTAPGFGKGHGPLNHAHTVAPFHPE